MSTFKEKSARKKPITALPRTSVKAIFAKKKEEAKAEEAGKKTFETGKSTNDRARRAAPVDKKTSAADKTDKKIPFAREAKKYINVYLSLGSNIGERAANIATAAVALHRDVGKIARESHLYETQPWGNTNQDLFLNKVIMVNTYLEPRQLLEKIASIERMIGRERAEKWGPRVIDIDILFYGKRVIRDQGLEIPHPEIANRAFILVPMLEIEPDFVHPISGLAMDELYADCRDDSDVVMLGM